MTHISRSRRGFFRATLMGAATAAFAGPGLEVTAASAQTTLSPEAALQELIEGNRRFTEGRMTSFNEDLDMLKTKTSEQQEPFAAVMSCADSRVPVELIFDQSIGHLFVARVDGNIATSAMIASLEYGVAVLGTKAIMVLGHGNCGAVKASIEAKAVPGQISSLYPYIRPAVDQAGPDLEAAIKANAKIQAALLRQSSPVIAEHINAAQAVRAQQKGAPLIRFLASAWPGPNAPYVAAFGQGLSQTDWVVGQNVMIEYRWAEGQYDRLPGLAADLVDRKVDVIATSGGHVSALAAKNATSSIPIVFLAAVTRSSAGWSIVLPGRAATSQA